MQRGTGHIELDHSHAKPRRDNEQGQEPEALQNHRSPPFLKHHQGHLSVA
jgi:hypothetical protein